MIERNRSRVLIWSVPDRTRTTLQPLITGNVVPGSTIHSDEWPPYANLAALGFVHMTVNHSDTFVAADGTHTNTIEGFWGNAKQYFKRMRGVNRPSLNSHLDEVMYRLNRRDQGRLASSFYPGHQSEIPGQRRLATRSNGVSNHARLRFHLSSQAIGRTQTTLFRAKKQPFSGLPRSF